MSLKFDTLQGGYADVISLPSRRPLRSGDVLVMDTGFTWNGYYCDFDQNWALTIEPSLSFGSG